MHSEQGESKTEQGESKTEQFLIKGVCPPCALSGEEGPVEKTGCVAVELQAVSLCTHRIQMN